MINESIERLKVRRSGLMADSTKGAHEEIKSSGTLELENENDVLHENNIISHDDAKQSSHNSNAAIPQSETFNSAIKNGANSDNTASDDRRQTITEYSKNEAQQDDSR